MYSGKVLKSGKQDTKCYAFSSLSGSKKTQLNLFTAQSKQEPFGDSNLDCDILVTVVFFDHQTLILPLSAGSSSLPSTKNRFWVVSACPCIHNHCPGLAPNQIRATEKQGDFWHSWEGEVASLLHGCYLGDASFMEHYREAQGDF